MTEFLEIGKDGVVTGIRSISQSEMLKCPHVIMVPGHYRDDNTCRCNDPDHSEMEEWGYEWDGEKWV